MTISQIINLLNQWGFEQIIDFPLKVNSFLVHWNEEIQQIMIKNYNDETTVLEETRSSYLVVRWRSKENQLVRSPNELYSVLNLIKHPIHEVRILSQNFSNWNSICNLVYKDSSLEELVNFLTPEQRERMQILLDQKLYFTDKQ